VTSNLYSYHVHQQTNFKEMKKILASLFVTSVAICSASAANAQVSIPPAVSVHNGTVPASCRFSSTVIGSLTANATPATLNLNSEGTSLSSLANPGSFTVICNSNHSFAAKLITGSRPSAIVESNYFEGFRFINTPSPYTSINTTTTTNAGFSNTFTTVPNLPATTATGYVVGVAAEAHLVDGAILPVSTTNGYVIRVEATVTAN
jgi:hypothetical protein